MFSSPRAPIMVVKELGPKLDWVSGIAGRSWLIPERDSRGGAGDSLGKRDRAAEHTETNQEAIRTTAKLDFEARVPVPFSIFPGTYREPEKGVQTHTKVHEKVEVKVTKPAVAAAAVAAAAGAAAAHHHHGREDHHHAPVPPPVHELQPPRVEQRIVEEEIHITREEEVRKEDHHKEHHHHRPASTHSH
ncbi:hypothetical protein B0T09DRAFT_362130, partial [Sordaria sp. MPI-SDFR-AT-0083]